MISSATLLTALFLSATSTATVLPPRVAAVNPVVSGTPQVLGVVSDPTLDRDSCGSSLIGGRVLWACRDTEPVGSDGIPTLPVISSTASWSDLDSSGLPVLDGSTYPMYGNNNEEPFYPLQADECDDNSAGGCSDGTRYAIWPDTPPLVTNTAADGTVTAYTWIRKAHITDSLTDLAPDPDTSLYKVVYSPSAAHDALPAVTIVDEAFWAADEQVPYGAYGSIVSADGSTAYLYGKGSSGTIALAKVPVGSIEDKTQYQFYENGSWTPTPPSLNASDINVPNASAGGQGTYFFSPPWERYVWIGQAGISVSADFFVTTAPAPEGPWAAPVQFYSAENGNATLGAYSLQANPALGGFEDGANDVYLTYTKNDVINGVGFYSTPLIKVSWE
ncbi:hypothetical protein CONPUDRAFT_126342 [Coniophora puteana RWD-64-598 SS2]|uniref:DUF4185 domain-containing protein n=1 Tax=Coniophora puteana (strain RWD-64-598) TaxID=741705 RepID=A0A5M3MLG2_CONPW|nr:uncharacterized protein CONPUDRAFT_126342 [Coniophora puteana RWD-64-598 SS2]EIW79896.1 hypothetical protein CONPUDRAFT_126342 [Coniophora puteana RWD-64-598 SS2]